MRYFIAICLMLTLVALDAQEYRHAIYQAYLLGEMDSWKDHMDQMDRDFSRTSDPVLPYDLLETANMDYHRPAPAKTGSA